MSCSALYWLKKTDEPDELDICGPILKWIFKLLVVSYDLRVGTYVESTGYELVLLEQRVVSYELKFETASYLREMRVKFLKLQLINKCLLLEKIMSYLKKCKLNSLKYCCPQIHYIWVFSFYLFQLNGVGNDGIVAVKIVVVFFREHARKV